MSKEENNIKIKQNMQKQKIKGSDIFVKVLEEIGVENIYHYPGGTLLDVNQSLVCSKIKTILSRHEQGSGFSAIGAAQFSGKTQVAMGISGPGATNLLTAIADAYMDSVPVVFISGQVPQKLIGNMAFQEINFNKVVKPVCKKEFLIKKASQIPDVLNKAFSLANSGRPGPIVIVFPKDVQQEHSTYKMSQEISQREYSRKNRKDKDKIISNSVIEKVQSLIKESKKPLIYAGGGIISSGSVKEFREFAEKNNIPVVTTLKGLGSFDETKDNSLGMLGMHGSYYANMAVHECDLLLSFGVRFDDRVAQNPQKFAPKAHIVHVEIDEKEIGRNKKAHTVVHGDIKNFLCKINQTYQYKKYAVWYKKINTWRKKYPLMQKSRKNSHVYAEDVFKILNNATKGNATMVTSVGQHQMQTAQMYDFRHTRQLITSGGLGTMGFCLPASIGVAVEKSAEDDKSSTIVVTGDGSVQMNMQELGTMRSEDLDVKVIIFNNHRLGMVTQWEDSFYNNVYADTDFLQKKKWREIDFAKIAEAYDMPFLRIKNNKDLDKKLEEYIRKKGVSIIEIEIFDRGHVLPMIPAGKTVEDIILK